MRQVLEMALEALEDIKDDCSGCEFEWSNDYPLQAKAHAAIKEALAQPEQEPVGCIPWHWVDKAKQIADGTIAYPDVERAQQAIALIKILLKSTPPQRKPLTDEQIDGIASKFYPRSYGLDEFARAIEAAHGIKE